MARDSWAAIIQWTCWAVITALVMRWVWRSRFRKRPDSDSRILAHPVSVLVVGMVAFVFFCGIALISNTFGKNDTTTIWTTLVFLAFAFMSVLIIADYFFARHRVSEVGLDYGRMFGRRGTFIWSDVKRVSYASRRQCFVISLDSGARVWVSAMLMGLPEFAQLLLAHVPKHVIDDEAHALLLDEVEQGRDPNDADSRGDARTPHRG